MSAMADGLDLSADSSAPVTIGHLPLESVARTQTIVQLSDELITELDALRAQTPDRSRSELIREALEAYIAQRRSAAIDAAIVDGYTRVPPEEDFGARAAARASIEAEPWDTPE